MEKKKTKVVNIHTTPKYDVYIGRPGKGQDGYFGNPFKDGTRKQNIRAFATYFHERITHDPVFKKRIMALRGKSLGCFCHPLECHGNVIIEYLNKTK